MDIYYPGNQGNVVLYFLLLGVFLGLLYDVFKVKRLFLGEFKAVLLVDDVIYMALTGIIMTFFAFCVNNGRMRWYEFAPPILGFFAYRATISKIVLLIFSKLAMALHAFMLFCAKPFISVMRYVNKRIYALIEYNKYILILKIYKKQMCSVISR